MKITKAQVNALALKIAEERNKEAKLLRKNAEKLPEYKALLKKYKFIQKLIDSAEKKLDELKKKRNNLFSSSSYSYDEEYLLNDFAEVKYPTYRTYGSEGPSEVVNEILIASIDVDTMDDLMNKLNKKESK